MLFGFTAQQRMVAEVSLRASLNIITAIIIAILVYPVASWQHNEW